MEILKKRTDIPRVVELSNSDCRLVILPGEDKDETTNIGRRIGAEYWSVEEKIRLNIFLCRYVILILCTSFVKLYGYAWN